MEQHSNNSASPILETHVGLPKERKYNKRLTGAEYHKLHEFLAKVFVQIDGLWYWADGYNDQVVCRELQGIIPHLTDKAVWRYRTANFGYPAEKPRRQARGNGHAAPSEIEDLKERVALIERLMLDLRKANEILANHLIDVGKETNQVGLDVRTTIGV